MKKSPLPLLLRSTELQADFCTPPRSDEKNVHVPHPPPISWVVREMWGNAGIRSVARKVTWDYVPTHRGRNHRDCAKHENGVPYTPWSPNMFHDLKMEFVPPPHWEGRAGCVFSAIPQSKEAWDANFSPIPHLHPPLFISGHGGS